MSATARLHVETVGVGPPLVLLHGVGLHSGFFAPVLAPLAARARVYNVDLPGHGASAPVAPYTLDAIVDALDATLAPILETPSQPLTLLGWSFGGTVAQRYAARYPQRIARLVLTCTSPKVVGGEDWPHGVEEATLRRFGDELAVAYEPTLMRFLSLQLGAADNVRSTLRLMRTLQGSRAAPDAAALRTALDVLVAADLRGAAPGLAQPALVITGGRDRLTPAAAGAWLAQALPHARLAAIAEAAHIPFLSHTSAFLQALDAFLDDHPLA